MGIFIVIKFGYINYTYTKPLSYQQHVNYLSNYNFIESKKFSTYPSTKQITSTKCSDNTGICYRYYASNVQIKLTEEQLKQLKQISIDRENMVIEGFSIPIRQIVKYKYLTISLDKNISFFKPKF